MLILTRKIDEEIIIDSQIKIKIISISENNIKLGITAPPNIEILRGEIYEKVVQSTREAFSQSKSGVAPLPKLKINKLNKKNEES
ncbi:MAG: carbon storage regulator CsrA [Ignavibacteriaceae bacterium]|jgi:carbon storage regulator|nr:carbon storage regulator CsrA [Ignavibacteriaceae bacterium]